MKSSDLKRGADQATAPVQPTQEEIDKAASRSAWGLLARGLGLVAIYNVGRGVANNLNDAMGGSPSEITKRGRKQD